MAKTIQRIISYKATDNNKSFCLSISDGSNASAEMYYADIEDSMNVNGSYNKGCLRAAGGDQQMYSAIYNAKDLYFKSALYGNNIDSVLPNTHMFQNVFNYMLSADLSNLIQVDNYIYQLNNNMSNNGKLLFSLDIYSELSLNNGYAKMPNVDISTLKFDKNDLSIAKEDDTHLISVCNIPGILYNLFFEIPGTVKNDYDSGNYAANVYTTKNLYTSLYDMLHEGNTILSCARQYIAIDHCNNLVYLKYYDNVNYDKNSQMTLNSTCLYGHKYLKIEVLKALNRFESINIHKTNYYDIDIICEKLLASFEAAKRREPDENIKKNIDKVKQNLIYEILNCIQDICKQIAPVDTLIVKVNVLESEILSN